MEKIISQKVFIENLIMMSSNSCSALNVRNGDLLLYLEVFESLYYINRDDVETKLILFTNTSSNWTLGDHSKVAVTISKSDEALMLPYLALKLGRTTNCFIEAVSRVIFTTVFKNVLVSPLLRCRQIRLHGDEFGVNWTHTRNKYTYFGFSISVQKFESYFDEIGIAHV